MQTILNIINRGIAKLLTGPFLYLVEKGVNPYIIFILFIIIIFVLYFALLYKGNFGLFRKSFRKMPLKNKINWFIFLFGGILIAFILFYQMLDLFYSSTDVNRYHSSFIDTASASFGEKMMVFLEKTGIAK